AGDRASRSQGRRRYGVLPVQPPDVPERSRRRSASFLALLLGHAPGESRTRETLAARFAGHFYPRRQAQRRRTRTHRRTERAARALQAAPVALGQTEPQQAPHARRRALARP